MKILYILKFAGYSVCGAAILYAAMFLIAVVG